jgi:site-specific DNA recombinase
MIGLVRVSKERNVMLSPDIQVTAIEYHAAGNNMIVVDYLYGMDQSGSRKNSRWWKTLDEAIGLVENGTVDGVLVWKFSRVARDRMKWAVALERIKVAGGHLVSATEAMDLTTSTGRLGAGMLSEYNAYEAEVRSEGWKEAHAHRLGRGLPHSGVHRFGYTYDKQGTKTYSVDPETAPLLRELYTRYATGTGFQALAKSLNERGVKPVRAELWSLAAVARLLDTGFGAGYLRNHNKACRCKARGTCTDIVMVKGAHEPVIDEALWQAYLDQRARLRHVGPRGRHPRHALSGLMRCGLCGSGMGVTGRPLASGKVSLHARCNKYVSSRACPGVWAAYVPIELAVLEWLAEKAEVVDREAARIIPRTATAVPRESDVERLTREVSRLDKAIDKITMDMAMDDDTDPAVRASHARVQAVLAKERSEAAEALEEAARAQRAVSPDGPRAAAEVLRDWKQLKPEGKNAVLRGLVKHVTIAQDGTITIEQTWQ